MPFQPMDLSAFSNFLSQMQKQQQAPDIMGQFKAGFDLSQLPGQTARKKEQEELANALSRQKLQSEPENSRIANMLKEVQSQKYLSDIQEAQRKADLQNTPWGFTQNLAPNQAGQYQAVEMGLQSKDPNVQNFARNLQKALNTDQSSKESLQNQRNIYAATRQYAISPTVTKLNQDLNDINAGFMPGTNKSKLISPEQQTNLGRQYEAKIEKETEQAQIIQRRRYAANIEKTINSIDPKVLTQYAGAKGVERFYEQMKAPFGQESPEYDAWTNAFNKAEMMATQVRQFYGDSVQPSMITRLERLTNPSSWINNPQLALQNYNAIVDIIRQETGTYFESPSEIKKGAVGKPEEKGRRKFSAMTGREMK